MSEYDNIVPAKAYQTAPEEHITDEKDEKYGGGDVAVTGANEGYLGEDEIVAVEGDLQVTAEDLYAAEDKLNSMSLDRCHNILSQLLVMHKHDQNFPETTLSKIELFLNDPSIIAHPDKHGDLIREMKLESILATENSPYAEVRANVDPTDDPSLPNFTLRVWVIGIVFSGAGAFINQLFSVRQPAVSVPANVAQLLAYPVGIFMARVLPDKRFRIMGREHSLNPGPFNQKEHMLITIMANVAFNTPYTGYTIFVQALPIYFNQPYAYGFGYQILSTMATNFLGYGLAGLTRRFIVFPSWCIWPNSLSTLALSKAFHSTTNEAVKGPLGRTWTMSREKYFMILFGAMFVYWWFPGFIFQALSTFNWISWIAPNNQVLNNITGSNNGLGLNPWTTFDWNVATALGFTPLVLPLFVIMNVFGGMILAFFVIVAVYYTNTWNTGYLPINSNHTWDNAGMRFNVSNVINEDGDFDNAKYQNYSEPWMAAGNLMIYMWFFAGYTATITYAYLYHRREIGLGFKNLWRTIRRKSTVDEDDLAEDIHWKLMKVYPEVPEWWYMLVLIISAVLGMVGVGVYPTNTSPAVVVYGILMALIGMIPIGVIASVTGIQVTLNVLAEFIGGSLVEGNAIALNFFKMYGYVTCATAMFFANDLKIAHYMKIPPKHTFWAQMVATFVSTFICTAIFNFQMGFANVCTPAASFNFTCPGQNTFFTAAVFWGTLSPKRLFGSGKRYNWLLVGFPLGVVIVLAFWALRRTFPRSRIIRAIHPVMITQGALNFAPYNLSYMTPVVYLSLFSFAYLKKYYLPFWAKYNYVTASAFSAGVAVAAVIIFFGLEIPNVTIGGANGWWGNNVPYEGCEASACTYLEVPEVGYFGAAPGTNSFT